MTSHTPDINKAEQVATSPRSAIIGPIAANIAFVMELTLVPLLLPAIQGQFGLSIGELAWVFNSYGIAVAVGVLVGGWCGDVFNTRKVFAYGVAFFAAGSLLVASADSFAMLIAGRALQGLGGGIFSPLVPLLLTRASPLRPGRALIFWGSIAGYVAALAPLFYGSFLVDYGWSNAFVFIAIIASISLVILSGTPGADTSASYFRAKNSYKELLKAHRLWVTFLYVFCTYGCITYYLFRLPVWLSSSDVGAASVGFALSVVWLTFSGLSTLLRNMVDRHHLRTIMAAAPFLIAAGFLLSYFSENLPLVIVSSVLVGSGLACSNAPSTQLILRLAPQGMSAVSTSLDITFARLGGIITVAAVADMNFAYAAPVICVSCFIAAFCAMAAGKGLATKA